MEDFWNWVERFWGLILAGVTVGLMALINHLQKTFPTNKDLANAIENIGKDLQTAVDRLDHHLEDIDEDMNGLGEKFHRFEIQHMGVVDKVADHESKIRTLGQRLEELNTHGSVPMRELGGKMEKINITLARISTKMGIPEEKR